MPSFPFILPFMSAQPLESRSIPLSRTSSRSSYSALLVGTAIGEQETSHFPGQVQGAAQVQGPPESGFLSVFLTFNNIFLSLTDTFLLTIIPPSVEQFLTTQLWACLCTAPNGQKNSVYSSILPTHEAVEDFMSSLPVSFAPDLCTVFESPTPPDIDYFKTLPTQSEKRWGIYLLTLEKPDSRSKIYIGSGTAARGGVSTRLRQYDNKSTLPTYVRKALEDGYHIVHKGLLCWIEIPTPSMVPALQVLLTA